MNVGRIPYELEKPRIGPARRPGRSARGDFRFFGMNGPAKRALDLALVAPALLFLAPAFLLIALAVRLDGGPSLFRQRRLGRGGETFEMLKFRTMRVDAEAVLQTLLAECPSSAAEWETFQKLRKDPRVTPIGRLLRKTSLDELPQLFNIAAGQMSIVGQRPILPQQRAEYGPHIEGYERARPGLTGLWQIRGRNALSFEQRAEIGSEYVETWSLRGDIKIIALTLPAIIFADNAY